MKQLGFLLVLVGVTAQAAPSIPLRVTATVPPRACEFPEPCAAASTSLRTRVTVRGDRITYLGSTPSVSVDGDLLTVTF